MRLARILLVFAVAASCRFATVSAQTESDPLPIPLEPPQNVRFKRMGGEGISLALAIMQDRRGYMWLGSYAVGLYRYDGYTYERYLTDPDDENSLGANLIQALVESERGGIWVGTTSAGLDYFDPDSDTFVHFRHDDADSTSLSSDRIISMVRDSTRGLWVGTDNGLNLFDPETGTSSRFHHDANDPGSVSHDFILSLFEDPDGTTWVGSWGLNRYDPVTGTFSHFFPEPDLTTPTSLNRSVPSNWISAIFRDRRGRLWVGTLGRGVYRFQEESGEFRRMSIEWSAGEPGNQMIVFGITEDPQGGLWLGTDTGLAWLDPQTERVRQYRHDPTDKYSLPGNVVGSVYTDRQGILWTSAGFEGPVTLDRSTDPIEQISDLNLGSRGANTIADGPDGAVWLSGGSVLVRVDRGRGTTTYFRHDPIDAHSLQAGVGVSAVAVDVRGRIWNSLGGSLSYMDPGRLGYFHHLRNDPNDETSVKPRLDPTVYVTKSGDLWVADAGFGVSRLDDLDNGRFTHFSLGPGLGLVNSIFEDSSGLIWVGTFTGGLYRLDPRTGDFKQYDYHPNTPGGISAEQVYGISECASQAGILWVGAYGGGLNRLDVATETFTHITFQNSDLADNGAQGVICDSEGDVWISHDRGVSRYSTTTSAIKNFDQDDGLQDVTFNARAYHQSLFTGELFFGGKNGVNAFFPDDFADNPYPPQIVISGLKLFGEPVSIGGDSPLQKPLSETSSFTLKHFQNDVTFEYVGLHYSNSSGNRYAYMLEPYEDDWRMVDMQRSASFTNLDPGTYTFHVKAANSDGVWNEEGASVQMIILPPWWRTIWAYAMYGLLLLGGVFLVDRTQRQRLIRQEREKTRERELAAAREIERQHQELTAAHESLKNTQSQLIQSEKLASLGQLTSGIAHELKNPLNFVNNFADMNAELAEELRGELDDVLKDKGEETKRDLMDLVSGIKTNTLQIGKHGKRADAIVASMMAHAAAGGGERLQVAVNPFVEEYIRLSYGAFATQHPDFEVNVEQDLDADVGSVRMASQELGRALMNILSNGLEALHEYAAKAGEGYEPTIRVSTSRKDDAIEIRVADNGPGIPAEVQKKIFEPFFTTKPTGTGTGLGLSLTYDIVTQGHGGTLSVESEEGEGASFVIALPA